MPFEIVIAVIIQESRVYASSSDAIVIYYVRNILSVINLLWPNVQQNSNFQPNDNFDNKKQYGGLPLGWCLFACL